METRIAEHPILGVQDKGIPVTFTFDGKELSGYWASDNNVTYISHSHNNSSFKIHLNELKPITITYFVVGS